MTGPMMDPRKAAALARRKARSLRDGLTEGERQAFSRQIHAHLMGWAGYQKARTILCFASYGSEVDTWPILKTILSHGKALLLPRCQGGGIMEAMAVPELSMLSPGTLRIWEPPADGTILSKGDIDLILAPGLRFDGQGNRLGQGAGYYDRYLADYPGETCGIAFAIQVVDHLQTQPHDQPVAYLITEKGIIHTREETI